MQFYDSEMKRNRKQKHSYNARRKWKTRTFYNKFADSEESHKDSELQYHKS